MYTQNIQKVKAFDDTAAVSLALSGQARGLFIVLHGTDGYINITGGTASSTNGTYIPADFPVTIKCMHPSAISIIGATASTSGSLFVIEYI